MAITASYDTLLRQAPMTAEEYLRAAVRSIDEQFEKGYAQKHPELVAAFMQVCVKDMGTSTLVVAIQEAASQIAQALQHE
jgi:hypothetical protein